MRTARPRIWVLATVFATFAFAVLLHLYLLMIEQNDLWLERSYRNRWGFKDVPTRRGAILDRRGLVLTEDDPAFALLLHYRAFRREHAVGAAVHGANLVLHAGGISDDLYGFDDTTRGPHQALDTLLSMPQAWLARGTVPLDMTRDLRFYAATVAATLTGRTWWKLYRELRDAEATPGTTVADTLGPERVELMHAAYAQRLAELRGVAVAVSAESGGTSLWTELEAARRRHRMTPESEEVVRLLKRRISFELAARIAVLGDHQRGLWVRPSVARRLGALPGGRDLASLQPLIGMVTPYWESDRGRIEEQVGAMLDEEAMERLVPRDPDLPPELAMELAADAARSVTAHFGIYGRVGRWGVELDLDESLAGRPGLRLVERDARARETALWSSLDTAPGRDRRLTLDLELQAVLERCLDVHSAGAQMAAVVLDARSGDVLAVGGRPLPTPEHPAWTVPAAVWHGVGFVGSVAKPLVMLEQLDAARRGEPCKPITQFAACASAFRAHGLILSCEGHGAAGADGVYALAHSCNSFFYQAAQGLGAEGIDRAFRRFGWMGETADEPVYQRRVPGIELVGRAGAVAGTHALERRAIGYGMDASALHVARAYAALATGVLPRLGMVLEDRSALAVPLAVAAADLELVRDGMQDCVTRGTARKIEGLAELGVLAKTGTAEISTRTHDNNAWFAGYLTRADPTLAFAAVAYGVPDGHHGAEVAGALIADFLTAVYDDDALRSIYLPRAGR